MWFERIGRKIKRQFNDAVLVAPYEVYRAQKELAPFQISVVVQQYVDEFCWRLTEETTQYVQMSTTLQQDLRDWKRVVYQSWMHIFASNSPWYWVKFVYCRISPFFKDFRSSVDHLRDSIFRYFLSYRVVGYVWDLLPWTSSTSHISYLHHLAASNPSTPPLPRERASSISSASGGYSMDDDDYVYYDDLRVDSDDIHQVEEDYETDDEEADVDIPPRAKHKRRKRVPVFDVLHPVKQAEANIEVLKRRLAANETYIGGVYLCLEGFTALLRNLQQRIQEIHSVSAGQSLATLELTGLERELVEQSIIQYITEAYQQLHILLTELLCENISIRDIRDRQDMQFHTSTRLPNDSDATLPIVELGSTLESTSSACLQRLTDSSEEMLLSSTDSSRKKRTHSVGGRRGKSRERKREAAVKDSEQSVQVPELKKQNTQFQPRSRSQPHEEDSVTPSIRLDLDVDEYLGDDETGEDEDEDDSYKSPRRSFRPSVQTPLSGSQHLQEELFRRKKRRHDRKRQLHHSLTTIKNQLEHLDQLTMVFTQVMHATHSQLNYQESSWIPITVISAGVMAVGSYIYLNGIEYTIEQSRETSLSWITAMTRFFNKQLKEPLLNVYRAVRYDEASLTVINRSAVIQEELVLGRMVREFIQDTDPVSDAKILDYAEHLAVQGDITPIMPKYSQAIRTPIREALFGSLLRLVLIQVHKLKVDAERISVVIDQLLRSNEILFQVTAMTPAIILFCLALYQGHQLITRKPSKSHLYEQIRYCLYDIDCVLNKYYNPTCPSAVLGREKEEAQRVQVHASGIAYTTTGEQFQSQISQRDTGILVIAVHRLQQHAAWLSKEDRVLFMRDTVQLINSQLSISQKIRVIDRIYRTHSFLK